MRLFNGRETRKPKSLFASRDRSGAAGICKRQFAPRVEGLEERVVLTLTAVNAAQLLADVNITANSSPVDVTIDLNFSAPVTLTAPLSFNPTTAGVGLDIVNIGSAATINAAPGKQILILGARAGAVGVDGQSALIELEGASTALNGGAIQDNSPSALSVTNVVFTGNTAANGGAIYAAPGSGPLTIADSKFGPTPGPPATLGNIATGVGGAIDETAASLSSPLTITNTTFVSNTAKGGAGGAIYDSSAAGLTISDNSVFLTNTATNGTSGQAVGGAIAVNNAPSPISAGLPPTVVIDSTSFLENQAVGGASSAASPSGGNAIGGAIYSLNASLAITNTQFVSNTANGGNGANSTSTTRLGGGAGGNATAGALYSGPQPGTVTKALVNISQNVTFLNNMALAGSGGNGFVQSGGAGGAGGIALGGAVVDYGQGPDAIVASFYGNQALGGAGGTGGAIGGTGGAGGSAEGGALDSRSALAVSNSTFGNSLAQGGAGGAGGASRGTGGAGGFATGGAIENEGAMQLSGDTFTDNAGTGGAGGNAPGTGATGGAGGSVQGGAVFNDDAALTITQNGYFGNVATGGAGGGSVNLNGTTGKGGAGGLGGTASGGAVASTGRLSITVSQLGDNNANGGTGGGSAKAGGTGGAGGSASGGAIEDDGYLNSGSFVGSGLTVSANNATAGAGGAATGTSGTGGLGGIALGGGMFAYDLQAQVSLSTFSLNKATGGAGGSGSTTPGVAGKSFGGGLDNQGELNLTNDTFLANEALGGAGYTAGNGNNGSGNGGGVSNEILGAVTPALTVVDGTFTENTAQGGAGGNGGGNGGGLYSNPGVSGVVDITQSTFRENSALGGTTGNGVGGAIYSNFGGLTLTFSVVTLNSAGTSATSAYGAYYSGGPTTLSFDTITLNNAPLFPNL